jgi:hypothetical protein
MLFPVFFIFPACHRNSPSWPTSPWWPIKSFGPFLLWAQHCGPLGPPPASSPSFGRPSRHHPPGRRCRAVRCRLPRPPPRVGSQTEELPGCLSSPLVNLAPRQLLSLLHSLKWSVLNFHRRRSVASSDPSPHRPDAIKGARSHGHFTRNILPHLALLICAPSCPTPSTDTVFHSSPPPAQPRHRAAQFWPR